MLITPVEDVDLCSLRIPPELKTHYNLDDHAKEIEKVKAGYVKATKSRANIKGSIPTFEEYLKLLETTPAILGKIREIETMDALIKIFFSNFTITPDKDSFRKGSKVIYELKEPYKGFLENGDFVRGAT